jgi:hypothetical protein
LWNAGVRPSFTEAAALGMTGYIAMLLDTDPGLINTRYKTGCPCAIHQAVRYGHADTVALLIKHGADLNTEWVPGWTPLHVAENVNPRKGRPTPEIVALLCKHGARSESS